MLSKLSTRSVASLWALWFVICMILFAVAACEHFPGNVKLEISNDAIEEGTESPNSEEPKGDEELQEEERPKEGFAL